MAISVKLPWGDKYHIEHLVFDLNGTLANNGVIAEGTKEALKELAKQAEIHVITADTHNTARDLEEELKGIAKIVLMKSDDHTLEKGQYVRSLGFRNTAAFGNGGNDMRMLQEAILSIAVMGEEGLYAPLLSKVDLLVGDINVGIEMFLNPVKLVATLRK